MSRIAYLILGWTAVALGLIGVVLPGLPTTVFGIIAAFAFGKASPRARAWLMNHAHLGPSIRDWEERGAISRRAKRLAVVMMIAMFVLSVVLGLAAWVLVVQALGMGAGAAYILTRPD